MLLYKTCDNMEWIHNPNTPKGVMWFNVHKRPIWYIKIKEIDGWKRLTFRSLLKALLS